MRAAVPARRRVSIWDNVKTFELDDAPATRTPDSPGKVRIAARQLVDSLGSQKLRLPMLPQSASEAIRLAGDPSAGIREIERVLRGDPLIAARVLAVANSAMYGGSRVKTLQQALARLGTGSIRDVLYQAVSDAHIFRGKDAEALEAERLHSLAVAQATREICKQIGFDSAYAFVCGLLHDIGRPILHQLLATDPPNLDAAETRRLIELVHPVVGAKIARIWKLPSLVAEGCRRHHIYRCERQGGDNSERRSGAYSQIGNIVAAADRIAYHFGQGRPANPLDLSRDAVFFELGLDPASIGQIVSQLSQLGAE